MKVVLVLNIIIWVYYVIMMLAFWVPALEPYYNLYMNVFQFTVLPMVLFSMLSVVFALVGIFMGVEKSKARGILLYALLSLLLLGSGSFIYFSF